MEGVLDVSGFFLLGLLGKGAILVAAAFAATYALRSSSAAVRHAVWALAFAGLLLLPVASASLPGWQLPVALSSPASEAGTTSRAAEVPTGPIAAETEEEAISSGSGAPHMEGSRAVDLEGLLPASRDHTSWLVGLWLAGMLFILGRLSTNLFRIWRLSRKARPAKRWAGLLEKAKRDLDITRTVHLLTHQGITMPRTLGTLRPVILLPPGAEDWRKDKMRIVLLHELTHIRRCDYLTHLVAQVAQAVHWPNPLVWIGGRRLLLEREQACDDEVMGVGLAPSTYAGRLLEAAREVLDEDRPAATAPSMAHRPSELKRRIEAILDKGRSRRTLTTHRTIAMTTLFIASLTFLSIVQPIQSASPPVEEALTRSPMPLTTSGETGRSQELLHSKAPPDVAATGGVVQDEPEEQQSARAENESAAKAGQPPTRIAEREETASSLATRPDTTEKDQVQLQALHALSRLSDDVAIPRLIELARSHPNEEVRSQALHFLGRKGGEQVVTFFRAFVRSKENAELLNQAIHALGRMPDDQSVPALIDIAQSHPREEARMTAIMELSRKNDDRALETLIEVAQSPGEKRIRQHAMVWLGRNGSRRAVDTLIEIARTADDSEIRAAAIQWLGRSNDERAADVLMDILTEN